MEWDMFLEVELVKVYGEEGHSPYEEILILRKTVF